MSGRYALLLSSAKYADPSLTHLASPTADVDGLKTVLADPQLGGFEVKVSENLTYGAMGECIGDFLAEREREDTILLYFSGHGLLSADGELYFAASNTRLSRLEDTGLGAERLARQIGRCRAKKILLILDSCFSGAFPGSIAKGAVDVNFGELQGAGTIVLTASNSTEYAYEGKGAADRNALGTSVFTQAAIMGLQTGDADLDRDGNVSALELFGYLTGALEGIEPRQTPTMHATALQGDYVVAASPRGARLVSLPDARNQSHERHASSPLATSSYIGDVLEGVLNELEVAAVGAPARDEVDGRIATGIIDLDELTGGLRPGDLMIVSGESGSGKSSFVLGLVRYASIHEGMKSLIVSRELGRSEAVLRILAAEAQLNNGDLRTGRLNDVGWKKLARIMGTVSAAPLAFVDQDDASLASISGLVAGDPSVAMLVVDNLQMMVESERAEDMLATLLKLKLLAKRTSICVCVTIAGVEGLKLGQNPVGAIDRYADYVLNIYRDDLHNPESWRVGEADLQLLKNRHGPRGSIVAAFQPHYSRFANIAME